MSRSKTLPQPAQKAGALARLTQNILGNHLAIAQRSPRDSSVRPWLMESVSWGGIGLSAVLAGVGVAGLVGFESDLAKIGSGILVGGTVLTEIAAARLPTHAQKRFGEGAWVKGSIALFGFMALTGWNVTAAHFGMQAIDAAALQDRRAPLERAAAEADAARETAEEALAAHDAEAREERESMGLALRGAFQSGYITSSTRNAREAAEDRAERRVSLAQAVTDARGADRAAERALEAAPQPRPDLHLWLFAAILEICKGCLVWFSTASERRARPVRAGAEPLADKRRLADMTPAERRAITARAASVLAENRHLQAALA